MQKIVFLFSIVLLFACNSNDSEITGVLNQPPFRALTDSMEQDPDNASLHYRRGTMLYEQGHKNLAEHDLRKAWEMDPTEQHGLSLTTILKEKSADSAITFLEEAIEILPASIALHIGLARGYQQKGRNEQALAILDQIIQSYPGQLDALSLKSEILNAMDKPSEGLVFLERAQALVPSDPELSHNLAYEYAMIKDAKTLKLTDSLIRARAPEVEKAFYSRGIYFAGIGNSREAIKNFDAATKANYNFLDAYLDKGELLFNQKNYDEAQKNFELALKIAPANAMFYYWLGKCQEARGYKEEAKANYQRAYGLDKSLTIAKEAADRI